MHKTFPIEIHINPEDESKMRIIIETMIVNFDKWEKGEEDLKYRLGHHLSNNLKLIIKK